jgi:predicted ABC-type ATPase
VPTLTVIAGPNGSGKSTLARSVDFEGRERLLDPDAIAFVLRPVNPSAAAIAAARSVLNRTAAYLNQRVSFAIETTLSGRRRVDLLRRAKSRGYVIQLVFIAMDTPERCIARILHRVERGGHFVPDADVRRRYARSVANAASALRLADIAALLRHLRRRPSPHSGSQGGQSSVAGRGSSRVGQVVSDCQSEVRLS